MSLQKQIRDDMVEAMKSKNRDVVELLRVVAGEFGRKMNSSKELSDEEALKIIRKMSENAKELDNLGEVEILKKYLPQMFTEKKLKDIIDIIITENSFSGMKDMGKVMAELKQMPSASQVDGKLASTIIKRRLGGQ